MLRQAIVEFCALQVNELSPNTVIVNKNQTELISRLEQLGMTVLPMSFGLGDGVYVNSETVPSFLNLVIGIDVTEPQSLSAYHTPLPNNNEWLSDLDRRYDSSQRIIVFCTELHQSTVEDLLTLDRPKIELYLCGVVDHTFQHAQVYRYMSWFDYSIAFYKNNLNFLSERLKPFETKPLSFDILLGCQRPNRDYVYNFIVENNLRTNVIMTYFKFWNIDLRQSNEFILDDPDIEYIKTPECTVHNVRYHGHEMTLSQVIPLDIYNQTAYTLVTETNGLNHFNFYTEKIVKPILAQRLFVAIAGKNYLRNLRAMGFKTFDGIIDEAYDAVEDSDLRWQMAMEQVRWLCGQDQKTILDACKPIVEHNCNHMLSTDWRKPLV